jgi:hypothetical protein
VAPWNTIDYEYLLSGEMDLFMEDEGMAMRGAGEIDGQVGDVRRPGVAQVKG